MLHLKYSGFLKPDSLAKLKIHPGRITVVHDGTKTMGMGLCISAASKDKYQLEILAVAEIVILKMIHVLALAVVAVGQQRKFGSVE